MEAKLPELDLARPRNLSRPVSVILPRALREEDAAAYTGLSSYWLRKARDEDEQRLAHGEPVRGPRWIIINAAVRYLHEDLDDWLNSYRFDPAQGDPND